MTDKTDTGAISRRAMLTGASVIAASAAGSALAQTPSAAPAAAAPAPRVAAGLGGGQPTGPLFWTVDTATGKVEGMANGTIKEFRAIPYGAPTGGPNRYMPPKKPASWGGVRQCHSFGQISPQTLSALSSEYGRLICWDRHNDGGMGEDCLTLNIWTPSTDKTAKKAVMVSFHGGGWATGSGNGIGYDGAELARFGDVVVVTVNHRLGTFGYLNLIDLGAPPEFKYAGVCGVMDMVASLQWVKDNIEGFGGDASRVMVFGQSGGGEKTSVLMGTPAARGLFHRAGIQSGSTLRLGDKARAATTAETLLGKLNIPKTDIGRIQQLTWEEILQAGGSGSPILDGDYLPHHPFDPGAPAESADVPVIISTALHDAALSLTNWDLDAAGLRAIVARTYGDQADAIIAAHKAARPQDSNYLVQATVMTDASRGRGAIVQAERKAALGRAPAYMYEWDWASNMADGKFGAVHGLDVSATFHNFRDQTMSSGSAEGKLMADRFAGAYVAFAKTGSPNHEGIPNWPAYDAQTRATMIFDRDTRVVGDPRGALIRQLAAAAPPAGAGRGGAAPAAGAAPGRGG